MRYEMKLEANLSELLASCDAYAERAENESDLAFIEKSSSLHKGAKSKKDELLNLEKSLDDKVKEYKELP